MISNAANIVAIEAIGPQGVSGTLKHGIGGQPSSSSYLSKRAHNLLNNVKKLPHSSSSSSRAYVTVDVNVRQRSKVIRNRLSFFFILNRPM